jgi:hypothetical protein
MNLDKIFAGWGFRTNRPEFDVGEEFSAFLTDRAGERGEVRVGDTVFAVDDVGDAEVDDLLVVRVSDFDPTRHRGRVEVLMNRSRE